MPVSSRKLAIAATLSIGLICTPVTAGVPTVDGPNLAQNIANNIMQAASWAQEKGLKIMEMDLTSLLTKMKIQNDNNAAANQIIRNGRAMQEIQNKEIAEQAMAADNACAVTASAEAQKQIMDASQTLKERKAANFAAASQNFSAAEATASGNYINNNDQNNFQMAETLVADCSVLQSVGSGDVNEDAPMATSLCMRGSLLTSSSPETMTNDESAAVDRMNSVIAWPFAEGDSISSGKAGNMDRVAIARREIFQNMVFGSLQEVSSWRQPAVQGISPMMTLEKAVKAHYDPEELAKVSNADPATKNSDMPSEVQRKMAQMQALSLYIESERFKGDLRREALLSGLLALQIRPIEYR